jgi:acetyltransferase-like isoleucine patch superfamily enzyme
MPISETRDRLRPLLLPVKHSTHWIARWRRKARYLRDGIEGIAMELRSTIDCAPVLREYGATVGEDATIYGPLHVMNAEGDFSKLTIGERVYIGTNVLIDLAEAVNIGNDVSIGMGSHLITSFDVGSGPLKEKRPRKSGPVVIEPGAYLGTGVTILHGVTVGREATVGAHCLIRKDVAAGATYVAQDAQLLEH